ncbi:hypothetical protein [Streptomyces sp. ODS05-4]|uniref:hypothetical protein n=1 Tax=Streptomyces sp. ODS05-4 TaxID=2944939 RepID=UPI00210C99B0|nr:hypothetical protein [Streptomyces sp. ODS05-4]
MITEAGLPHHLVIPGIAEFARGGLPDPPTTDDGNDWVDEVCWLYCGQRLTRVLWIGPATVAGAQASMYACGPCIKELQQHIWRSLRTQDSPSRSVPSPSRSPERRFGLRKGGRHRRGG